MTTLKPCPFCGAPGFAMLAAYGFKIKCTDTDCTVETPIKTHRHQVDTLWNRRTTLADEASSSAVPYPLGATPAGSGSPLQPPAAASASIPSAYLRCHKACAKHEGQPVTFTAAVCCPPTFVCMLCEQEQER